MAAVTAPTGTSMTARRRPAVYSSKESSMTQPATDTITCYDCGHDKGVHHETSCDLCTACEGFVRAEEVTINLAPPSGVYSPHVRVLKDFVEELSRKLNTS